MYKQEDYPITRETGARKKNMLQALVWDMYGHNARGGAGLFYAANNLSKVGLRADL